MPDIPNVPGVPPLSSYAPAGGAADITTLLVSDAISAVASFLFGPIYGIFFGLLPIPVIVADNYVRFEHKEDYEISDYPVEAGSFMSYNKVKLPEEIRVRVSTGGSIFSRQALLNTIDLAMNTTGLYSVVTPEKVYLNFNFVRRDMVREADSGAGLIAVDITLRQILQTATALFQSTQNPSVAGTVSSSSVTPQPVPSAQSTAISGGVS
jgi:hypothetical protein